LTRASEVSVPAAIAACCSLEEAKGLVWASAAPASAAKAAATAISLSMTPPMNPTADLWPQPRFDASRRPFGASHNFS
jgi:hypothetical protein